MEPAPETATYHIARDGKVIGVYSFPALLEKFRTKAVLATDHYLIEGSVDWKLVGELKTAFANYEQEQKAREKRLKAEKRATEAAAREQARKDEQEAERRRYIALDEARKKAEQDRFKPWKCWTCDSVFKSDGSAAEYPTASGGWAAFFLMVLASLLGAGSIKEPLFIFFAVIPLIFALGFIIAYGVETGLQKFNSYRPRCPKCSSTHCSRIIVSAAPDPQAESPPTAGS